MQTEKLNAIKSTIKDGKLVQAAGGITQPQERAAQKKRLGILQAMYREALERMEAARPPQEKHRTVAQSRLLRALVEASKKTHSTVLARLRALLSALRARLRSGSTA